MPYRLLVTDEIDPEGVALLRAVSEFTVDEVPTLPAAELLARIGEYDAIIGRSATKISEPLLRAGKKLRVVGRAGVGIDNIAMATATELGIAVINAPGGNTVAVAELFFGSLIALLRHIPRADRSMHEGRWERSALLGSELRGRTLGIVGLGRIGSAVAQRARDGFGMRVLAWTRSPAKAAIRGVTRVSMLEELLANVDVLSLHCPATPATRHLIGPAQLAKMKPTAILVNTARGDVVDEAALVQALARGRIAGAGLDVYEAEPRVHPGLIARNDVVLLPHLGSATRETRESMGMRALANLESFFAGTAPPDRVR